MPPNMVPKNTDVQNSMINTLRSPGLSKYPKGTQSDTLPKSNEEQGRKPQMNKVNSQGITPPLQPKGNILF